MPQRLRQPPKPSLALPETLKIESGDKNARQLLFGEFGDKWHLISHIDPELYENSEDFFNSL